MTAAVLLLLHSCCCVAVPLQVIKTLADQTDHCYVCVITAVLLADKVISMVLPLHHVSASCDARSST
jgi:hypothetical protein